MKRVTSPLLGGSLFQRKTIKSSMTFLDAKREWRMVLCAIAVFRTCLDAVAHGAWVCVRSRCSAPLFAPWKPQGCNIAHE